MMPEPSFGAVEMSCHTVSLISYSSWLGWDGLPAVRLRIVSSPAVVTEHGLPLAISKARHDRVEWDTGDGHRPNRPGPNWRAVCRGGVNGVPSCGADCAFVVVLSANEDDAALHALAAARLVSCGSIKGRAHEAVRSGAANGIQ